MIRLVVGALIAVFVWALLVKLVAALRRCDIDWTGVTAFVGFVVLAFWLRHLTGIG